MSPVGRLSIMALAAMVWAGSARANSVTTVSGVGSSDPLGTVKDLAASARFEVVTPGVLEITLTNTSTYDVLEPMQVLTAVFFDIPSAVQLSPVSAALAPGAVVHFGPTGGGDVGGEWAYRGGLDPGAFGSYPPPPVPAGSQLVGISSVGLDLFGPHDRFHTNMLTEPNAPDGLDYGITSAGDDPATGNTPVTGGASDNPVPLIQNSVVFTFGVQAGFNPGTDVTHVFFQYGTDLSEPRIYTNGDDPTQPPIPEPLTALGAALGIGALGGYVRRRAGR